MGGRDRQMGGREGQILRWEGRTDGRRETGRWTEGRMEGRKDDPQVDGGDGRRECIT